MLADRVAEALRVGGPLASALQGFEPRPGQAAMAARVAEAIDNDERLLVEAGTGTGKTLAYLLPAILSGRKVVISTGTKTLQDQIARIDLPRLNAALTPFSFTVMKGLSNYLCLRRFHEHSQQAVLGLGEADPLARVRAWIDETATGDRADLTDLPEDSPLWREITATPETRLGARCPYFERCFVTGMRRRAAEAQIVLTNHHLFFADLALRARWPEVQVLPPYEAVIFDEAHQIEEVATEFFGLHVSSLRMHALARDIGRASVPAAVLARGTSLARRLQAAADAFAEALRARLPAPRLHTEEVRVPVPADLWAHRHTLGRYHELDTVLEDGAAFFDGLAETTNEPIHGGLARRAAALRGELGQMIEGPGGGTLVRWLVASSRNVSLRASPIDVGPILKQRFEAHAGPLVFTSATLSAAGGFDYVRDRLGLGDAAADATFPSPFRYARQALIYVATDLRDPTEEGFAAAAAERALELCRASSGRALLLFTSFRNLRVAEERLRADGGFPVLVQGERPRHVLLAALRERLGSVLLATQSFWEGVDVPGEALSLVVIDRLPFAVPDDPLTAARIDRIREEGGDPFSSYQLPRAALALKQGFGRLIRTRRDRGVVALLDGRILRRPYGSLLLASLPRDCPRTETLDDVTRFFPAAGMLIALFVLGGFVLGSIPTGVIVARARGVDLRKVGSGNIGATNVGRALGKGWAIFVLVMDAAKGYLPTALAPRWLPPLGVAAVGIAAVLGHMFSVFLKGRGGKGVATSLGAALALSPLAALCSTCTYLALYAAFRISSVGSLVALAGFPLALWLTGDRELAHYLFAGAIAVLVIARHKENIRRLVRGEELKA